MTDFRKRAFDFYTQLGYKPAQAAALAGNLNWESGGGNPLAVGDAGKSRGLAQWDPNRFAGLQSFATQRGLDPKDEATQLQYAHWELNNSESPAGKAFFAAPDLKGANDALMGYFRPQGYTSNNPAGAHGYVQRFNEAAPLAGVAPMAQVLAMPPTQVVGGPGVGGLLNDAPPADDYADMAGYNRTGVVQMPPTPDKPSPFNYKGLMGTGMNVMAAGEAQQPDWIKQAMSQQLGVHRPQMQGLLDDQRRRRGLFGV